MNEFEVFVADQAALEIVRISDYLKNVLCSEQANDHFLEEIGFSFYPWHRIAW